MPRTRAKTTSRIPFMIRKPPSSPDGGLGRPKPDAVVSGLRMNSVPNQRMKRMKAAARTVLIFFSGIVLLLVSLREPDGAPVEPGEPGESYAGISVRRRGGGRCGGRGECGRGRAGWRVPARCGRAGAWRARPVHVLWDEAEEGGHGERGMSATGWSHWQTRSFSGPRS